MKIYTTKAMGAGYYKVVCVERKHGNAATQCRSRALSKSEAKAERIAAECNRLEAQREFEAVRKTVAIAGKLLGVEHGQS